MRRKALTYDDTAENPFLRPTLNALLVKLTHLKSLRDDAAKYRIINGLMWEIRHNGPLMVSIMRTALSDWQGHSDHKRTIFEHERPLVAMEVVEDEFGRIHLLIPELDGFFQWFGFSNEQEVPTLDQIKDVLSPEALENPETTPISGTTEDESKKSELTKESRKAIEQILFNHHYRFDRSMCACGRPYDFPEEWAKHASFRVKDLINNEFKSDD